MTDQPPKDLATARRLAVEAALAKSKPKPSLVRKGPSPVRIKRIAKQFIAWRR